MTAAHARGSIVGAGHDPTPLRLVRAVADVVLKQALVCSLNKHLFGACKVALEHDLLMQLCQHPVLEQRAATLRVLTLEHIAETTSHARSEEQKRHPCSCAGESASGKGEAPRPRGSAQTIPTPG